MAVDNLSEVTQEIPNKGFEQVLTIISNNIKG